MTAEKSWPFDDPKNVAVFTSRHIVEGREWIHYVSHDEDDGGWQFHPVGFTATSDAMLVSLESIFLRDPSVGELADLPLGWCATRRATDAAWSRTQEA